MQGQPAEQYDASRRTLTDVVLAHRLSDLQIRNALNSPSETSRNAIVFARISEIDALYNQYETALLVEARQSGFLLSLAGLGAGLLGGYTTGQTSQVYSLIGGGVEALQTSYDKELLADRTIQAFISQMRAGRAKVLSEIYPKLSQPVANYPIEAAVADLERYRQAGTLATAIVGITENAATVERLNAGAAALAATKFTITDVKRTQGPEITAADTALPRIQRLTALSARVTDGSVPDGKVIALLDAPPAADPAFKLKLEQLRSDILSGTGRTALAASDIDSVVRGLVAAEILEVSGDPIVQELETKLQ